MELSHSLLIALVCGLVVLKPTDSHNHKSHRHHHHQRLHDSSRHPDHHNEVIPRENQEDLDSRLALQHNERVGEAGACEVPKLQVIHVSDHYPGRYYLPHCTLLHRCGKHAGCCGTDRLKCVAETKEKVTLNFYSVKLGGDGEPAERKIEKLTFSNHTKCGCVPVEHYSKHDL